MKVKNNMSKIILYILTFKTFEITYHTSVKLSYFDQRLGLKLCYCVLVMFRIRS